MEIHCETMQMQNRKLITKKQQKERNENIL